MSTVTGRSFGINLKVLKMLLLYSPEKYSTLFKLRASVIYIVLMFYVPILGSLYFVLAESVDMKRIGDNAIVLAEVWCYAAKLLPFITKADRIKNCIHYFESPNFATLRKNQQETIDACSAICKRNSNLFFTCMTGGLLLWAVKPVFQKEYMLPIDVWLPINPLNNLKSYYSAYACLALGVGYPSIASAVIEPLIAGLACLASGYLRVLKDNLTHIYEYTEEEVENQNYISEDKIRAEIMYRRIRECVDYHSSILNFVKEYEECFSQVVFTQFVGSVFVLGFCCLQLTILEPLSADFLSTLSYLVVLLAQIYLYCYYGTSLFEESNNLTNAVYMGQWYKYDIKSRIALIIFMERSKKPIAATAGKILDLSLVTFTTILRRSYSLVAVLKKM